jgi:CheY-like chemotaxis protein
MDPAAVSCFSGVRALIVNPSPASRQAIAGYLSSWGIENAAVSGEAESLGNLKPARDGNGERVAVLIDEQTPGVDALRLARAIKDRGEIDDIKVIVLSAESVVKNRTGVVDAWITKPVRPSHLFSCLLKLYGDAERRGDRTIAAAPPSPTSDERQQWRKAVRVLLVDDNLVNRTLGAKQLSMLGYTAEIVDGGRRALEVVSIGRSDIVLMDCEMPEMDGYEAVAEIRRREGSARHTVVIALTAHATEGERGKCLTAGMDDYLSKPVKLQTLAAMLDTWSRGKLEHPAAMSQ